MTDDLNEDLLERIADLEDQLSVWEARAEDDWVPWEEGNAAAGLPRA